MIYAPNGSINIISSVDQGRYSPEGYYRYTDATAEAGHIGIYAPDGSLNFTVLTDELTRVPLYAPNGSIHVVEGAGEGRYSPCGAWNVTIQT